MSAQDDQLPGDQQEHWQRTYRAHPGMYGQDPSAAAVYAGGIFRAANARSVVELGAGHGRDALYLAGEGFHVIATDFSTVALAQLDEQARARHLAGTVETVEHDVRRALPLPDASADGVFAHMLLCMALSAGEIRALVEEVRRILRPTGTFVYTVRHTGDAHYCAGIGHGEGIWEHTGFAVRYFPRELVDELAEGWDLAEVHAFEEGELPRRLWRVTQRKAA